MRNIFYLLVAFTLTVSCHQKNTTIALNKVGDIDQHTTIKDLDQLFKNDSIVSQYSEGDLGDANVYVLDNDTHLIYKKGGTLMLSITPVNPLDSISKIKSITIFTDEYKTAKNVGIASVFKDLNIHHNIDKLVATFRSVTVFVKDLNATFTLEKEPLGIKTFTLGDIDKSQIPENSKFTSLTFWFQTEE